LGVKGYSAKKIVLVQISLTFTNGTLLNTDMVMAAFLEKKDTGFYGLQLMNLRLKVDM
jgi:hypothetical protein